MNLTRTFLRVSLALIYSAAVLTAQSASAAILYESGTLGSTGIPSSDVFDLQIVPGSTVASTSFQGVRFSVSQPSLTTRIGGHFVTDGSTESAFFGAIVELDHENDFPDSDDLSTPDVLGTTLLTFPEPSDEVFGNLSLSLSPGWYALVFGSGLFAANGNGAILRNNTDIGAPDYIGFAQGFGWGSRLPSKRLVVEGSVVPEPSSIVAITILSLISLVRRNSHKR